LLQTNLPHAQSDIARQSLDAVFGDPNQVAAVMKRAVLAFVVLHNHTLQKNEL